jgi:hypothetical protein
MLNKSFAVPLPLVAVTRTSIVPVLMDAGVPLNVRVDASNVSHAGNAFPLDNAAVYVDGLPEKVLAANAKLKGSPTVATWSGIGLATKGATRLTVMLNKSLAVPFPLVAVTRTSIVPVLLAAGVPLNVRVDALKVSHAGNAFPFDNAAV